MPTLVVTRRKMRSLEKSEDEVEPVDNEIKSFLALKRVGYGTNSLLEQWRKTYMNGDYDYDPYEDDLYEVQEISDNIQSICDNLDIKGCWSNEAQTITAISKVGVPNHHLKRNCLKNNRKKSTSYVKKDEQSSSSGSTYDDSEVMMVMSAQALLDWIMDSGCSYHMIPRIRRDNCVYSLDGHEMTGELNASVEEKDSLSQVWHKRLGHISEAGLQVLEKQGLFGKKSLGKLDFCVNYVLGKSHRVSFSVGRHTTQGVIDYVHSDLWGPSQVESLGGKRYFLSIVDDYSKRVSVYTLRFKHKEFGKFKEWKYLVETQIGRTVKKLRTHNGLEFCNREFEQLCIESRIARH
ncbi:retrovirus-related pol polyprotein from transposon TNT 1-94 [Tanacetum coccineum]